MGHTKKIILIRLLFALAAVVGAVLWASHAFTGDPEPDEPFVWDGRLGDARFAHDNKITSVLPLPDGKRILSCSRDKTIRLWDLSTGEELRRFMTESGSDVNGSMMLSPDGKMLTARVGYSSVMRWDFETGEVLDRLDITLRDRDTGKPIDDFLATNLAVLASGDKVLAGYGEEGFAGRCVLWDISAGEELQRWTFGKNDGVEALCPMPDGRTAWVGVGREVVRLDLQSGEELERVSLPPPRELRPGEYRDQPDKQAYMHGLIRGMVLADDGRRVLVSQSDRGFSVINAASGEVEWNSKQRFQLSLDKYASSGPWVIGLDGLVNVETQVFQRLPGDDFTYAWSPDRSVRYGFKGNRVYGFEAETGDQLFPAKYGRDIPSYVGVEEIYLLDDGRQVLIKAGYPGAWWSLWDLESRAHLPRKIFEEKWKESGSDRIHDVHEATGRLAGVAGSKGAFTVGVDQSFGQSVMLATEPNRPPRWLQFAADPGEIVGTHAYPNAQWWAWKTSKPSQTAALPTPTYKSTRGSSAFNPPLVDTHPDTKRLRMSADRKTLAIAPGELIRPEQEGVPDVIFWSFPTMERLGTLDVGDLLDRGHFRPHIDLAFSRVSDERLWVWRIPPRSSSNAWWASADDAIFSGQSKTLIGPRLELRQAPNSPSVDYRLLAAIDLPITVELLAEHPDGRHLLVYGKGRFDPGDKDDAQGRKHDDASEWGRSFVWLRIETGEVETKRLVIQSQFQLPLIARSLRFTPDGQLLIGSAAGTVEIYRRGE